MTEIELKFALDEAGVIRLKERLKELDLNETAPRAQSLRTVYFDTPDHRLKALGTALRLRQEGQSWTQTVKARATINGGLMRTQEVDNPSPDGQIDLTKIPVAQVRTEIEQTVNGHELSPVCETRMKRAASVVTMDSGARIELAVDTGDIVAGDRKKPFHEVELELKEGAIDSLYDLTASLFPEGGLHLSTMTKSARGYMLAEFGKIEHDVQPRNAKSVPLKGSMTSEIAARDILRECFEQISANVDVVLSSDAPEGPHQLRIGLRRLRSALGMFKTIIGHPEMARLNEDAKALGAEVGALRDLDVVITDIIDPSHKAYPSEAGFNALRAAVETRRAAVRHELRETLRGAWVQSFQIDLARFVETRRWLAPEDIEQTARLATPVRDHTGKALNKRWKSVKAHARGIDHLTIAERHELRKELKKLRYTIEFSGPLYGDRKVTAFVRKMKKLQDVFGSLNDLAMAENLLCQPDSPGARSATAQRAVGLVLGTRTAQSDAAWTHATELWNAVTKAGPFWD